MRALRQVPSIGSIVLALEGVEAGDCLTAIDHPETLGVRVTPTFSNRWQSIEAALRMEPSSPTVVLHEPERPLLTPVTLQALLGAVRADGAMLGVAVHETIKRVVGNKIVGTIPRETVHAVQLPCVFRRESLSAAVGRAIAEQWSCADELQLAREAGLEIHLVGGQRNNLPIQSARDARFAELRTFAASLVLDAAQAAS